jgi:hypothetical protein
MTCQRNQDVKAQQAARLFFIDTLCGVMLQLHWQTVVLGVKADSQFFGNSFVSPAASCIGRLGCLFYRTDESLALTYLKRLCAWCSELQSLQQQFGRHQCIHKHFNRLKYFYDAKN